MKLLDRLFGHRDERSAEGRPRFLRKDRSGGSTYEVYSGADADSARTFLMSRTVSEPQYYVVVETPDGTWGTDKEGLYLEKLRPWQTDIGTSECEVAAARLENIFSLGLAAQGITDNFISTLACGACGREWSDGVRYQEVTIVRCPDCGKKNSVDTRNVHAA